MNKNKKNTSGEESVSQMITPIVAQDKQLNNPQADPAQQVEFAQKAAKALMVVIDATKPLVMQGKRYLYFEHWQTIARFFNTTVGIESTNKDANGYIAKAIVYNKDGVVIGGAEASCMKDEYNWKSKPDFQLRSMAQTRAMAKALRSMYGFVAILAGVEATPAEEMNDVEIKPRTFGEMKAQGGTSNYRGSPGIGTITKEDEIEMMFIKDFEKCTTFSEWNIVCGNIAIAEKNGKISKPTVAGLRKVAQKNKERIEELDPDIVTADDVPFDEPVKAETKAAKIMGEAMEKARKNIK